MQYQGFESIEYLRQAALANTREKFGYVFSKASEGLFIDRMDQKEEIAARFRNENTFRHVVGVHLVKAASNASTNSHCLFMRFRGERNHAFSLQLHVSPSEIPPQIPVKAHFF